MSAAVPHGSLENFYEAAFLGLKVLDARASGRRYEIDALILGYHALYLVEIKSHPATVSGSVVDWVLIFADGGRSVKCWSAEPVFFPGYRGGLGFVLRLSEAAGAALRMRRCRRLGF